MKYALNAVLTSALATAFASGAAAKTTEPIVVGRANGIEMPEVKRAGGAKSIYDFDSLEVGEAFGVKGKDKKAMQSPISNAHKKYKVKKTDDAGNTLYETKTIKGDDGQDRQVPDTEKPKMEFGRHFVAFDVTKGSDLEKKIKGTPLEGSSVVVFRDQ